MSPPCRFLEVSEEAIRNPSSCEAQNASFCTFRNLSFDRSTREDKQLYLTSFTAKNRPKANEKDTVSSFPKTGKQHLTLRPATHLPRSNQRLLRAAIMHTSHWKTGHGSSPVLSSTTKTHSSTYCTTWNVSEFSLLFGHMHCTTFSLILVVKRTDGLMKDEKFARSSCSGFIAQWLERLNTQVRSAAGLRSCRRWFSSDPAVKSYFCLRGKGKSLMFFLRLAMIIPKANYL